MWCLTTTGTPGDLCPLLLLMGDAHIWCTHNHILKTQRNQSFKSTWLAESEDIYSIVIEGQVYITSEAKEFFKSESQ